MGPRDVRHVPYEVQAFVSLSLLGQGRSQDFSGGVSQEPQQQWHRRGVCDARAHTSSTLMLASLPWPRPSPSTSRNAQAQFKHCARRGDFGTKLRKSSQLTFDCIMLVPRMSTTLLQALHHASDTRPIDPWALPPVPISSLAEPRLLAQGAPRRLRSYFTLNVSATRLSVPL